MNWYHSKDIRPVDGQVVLGHDADIGEVSIFIYRAGKWHYRDQDHFQGSDVTWWAPLPEVPGRKGQAERGKPEFLVICYEDSERSGKIGNYVVSTKRKFRTVEQARNFAAGINKRRLPRVAQILPE